MPNLKHLTAGLLLALAPLSLNAQAKRKVAVLDFNYATVRTAVAAIFGTDQDVGKGITDLLIDKLVNDGTYRVIERQAMSKIMAEQNFSNSNRADSNSAAQIGKLLGVDAIIIGDITQFGRDDKNVGGAGAGAALGHFGLGAIGVKKGKATVAITARLVDVNTGEILASITGTGSSERTSTNLLGAGAGGSGGGAGAMDMSASNFAQTIIGESVHKAVDNLGAALDAKASILPAAARASVSGMVADVAGSELVLNVGMSSGIQIGDVLNVARVGRVIKDPATGKPLRSLDTTVGTVKITSADSGSAVGIFTSSGGAVKVGDKVLSR